MAGYGDILDSFISGQNQALANQLNLTRIQEQMNQNAIRNQQWQKEFDANAEQRKITNDYNQGILKTQQDANTRAQQEFDATQADKNRNKNIAFALQNLDFRKDWTVEDALNPKNEAAWRALNNIPEVREMLGGEIRVAVVPGSEDRPEGPLYSFQVFNDKTGTTGPLTSLRGNQKDEFVLFHDQAGVERELNNIRDFVRSSVGVDPRYITESNVGLMARGQAAENESIKAMPEIPAFGSAALNADRIGASAAPATQAQGAAQPLAGVGPVGTGAPYAGTVEQGNAVAAAIPSAPAQPNTTQITQQLDAATQNVSRLEAMYEQARGVNPVLATQLYQELAAAYDTQAELAAQLERENPAAALAAPASQPQQPAPTPYAQQQFGLLGGERIRNVPATPQTQAQPQTQQPVAPQPQRPQTQQPQQLAASAPPQGYGSEERILRTVQNLAGPFLQSANGARGAYNAAASYTGVVPTANELEAINFSRRNNNITDSQATGLMSDADPAGNRTVRTAARMTEARNMYNSSMDNARAVVTNTQDSNKEVVNKWLTEQAGITKKDMELEAKTRDGADKAVRDAYSFLTDTIAPNVMDQLAVPDYERATLTGVVTNVWSTLPELPGPNNTKISLRSNDPGQQQRIATGVAKAYRELNAYNDGAQLKPYGFFNWMADVVTPDILRDWSRTDFNSRELNGTAFAAYAMSGLDPRTFASVVMEPMAAAKGSVSAADAKRLMGSIMLFEQSVGRAPTEDDIRNLVRQAIGE